MESTTPKRKPASRGYYAQARVMKDAWRAARKAQTIFGGSVRQYIAEAMRQAWAELLADPVYQETRRIIARSRAYRQSPQAHAVSSYRANRSSAGAWIGQ